MDEVKRQCVLLETERASIAAAIRNISDAHKASYPALPTPGVRPLLVQAEVPELELEADGDGVRGAPRFRLGSCGPAP